MYRLVVGLGYFALIDLIPFSIIFSFNIFRRTLVIRQNLSPPPPLTPNLHSWLKALI